MLIAYPLFGFHQILLQLVLHICLLYLKSADILAALIDFDVDILSFILISSDSLAALFAYLSFDLKSADNVAALFDFNVDILSFILIASDPLVNLLCFLSVSLKRRDSLCFCLYKR